MKRSENLRLVLMGTAAFAATFAGAAAYMGRPQPQPAQAMQQQTAAQSSTSGSGVRMPIFVPSSPDTPRGGFGKTAGGGMRIAG
ncbi:hypothetical protein GJW-30_1_00933 [Variibacter gotjawalensis]|uniref:Uncharacterized protein n=1 Tax=Variibacter gotjawalensis TaxID=1333996 RepID=A0A0S3PR25_9BRAD|nr:hypothetical protein [Variibacter gotjawalensis]NIK48713.1 hypothetical protein [Variibacter gotjawalensis]RZS50574.1 hypothetical protein EV661_3040 [Variibacter gotjawalensis]BAT58408.1 hypothetical protein GJW-30_1_00933 [Variibacter gotjawalensis]